MLATSGWDTSNEPDLAIGLDGSPNLKAAPRRTCQLFAAMVDSPDYQPMNVELFASWQQRQLADHFSTELRGLTTLIAFRSTAL